MSLAASALFFALFTGVRGIGILRTSPFGDSRKFAVASSPTDAAASTRKEHGGTASPSARGSLVAAVEPLCIGKKGVQARNIRGWHHGKVNEEGRHRRVLRREGEIRGWPQTNEHNDRWEAPRSSAGGASLNRRPLPPR